MSASTADPSALTKTSFGKSQLPGWTVGKSDKAAVIVLQEWWGITDCVKRQGAYVHQKTGFQVLVPDLYKGKMGVDAEEASHMMNNLDFMGAAGEIKEAAEWLHSQGAKKIGVVGFCMGGALALLGSITGAPLDAVVAFYGTPEGGDPTKVKAPAQCHSGSEDAFKGFADPATVKPFVDKINGAGGHAEFYEYKGQNHGFMNDTSSKDSQDIKGMMSTGKLPIGSEEARELGWSRTIEFLNKHL